MNIGIIGTGSMATALGAPWAERGHSIVFGSRTPQSAVALAGRIGKNACGGSYAEAARFGEVVVLAVPYSAAHEAVTAAGDLGGKVLIDITNPIAPGMSGFLVGADTSGAGEIASWASGARVVKAFNVLGARGISNLRYDSQTASTFICGDDPAAKSIVSTLGQEIGFDVIDAGPLANANLLESLAMLWVKLAYQQGYGPDIALKLMRR